MPEFWHHHWSRNIRFSWCLLHCLAWIVLVSVMVINYETLLLYDHNLSMTFFCGKEREKSIFEGSSCCFWLPFPPWFTLMFRGSLLCYMHVLNLVLLLLAYSCSRESGFGCLQPLHSACRTKGKLEPDLLFLSRKFFLFQTSTSLLPLSSALTGSYVIGARLSSGPEIPSPV